VTQMRLLGKFFVALAAAAIVSAGCSGSGSNSDTYLRVRIEDQHYELDHVVLHLMSLPKDGWLFFDLGQDVAKVNIVTAVPSASIQWRMKVGDLTALEGRNFDLDAVNDPAMATPNALFRLTEDVSVFNDIDSAIIVAITTVSDGIAEGTFEGSGFFYVSDTTGASRKVGVSGSYRAKIGR